MIRNVYVSFRFHEQRRQALKSVGVGVTTHLDKSPLFLIFFLISCFLRRFLIDM